ncbi:hypothetical protein GCM10023349_28830 [Nocardioides conyzicola]|uniref:Uncharacterized protein n=1 Tax=Nocardioides conyzicola TaxID=1651781 RepID=A0ABP8XIU9_9ACTN
MDCYGDLSIVSMFTAERVHPTGLPESWSLGTVLWALNSENNTQASSGPPDGGRFVDGVIETVPPPVAAAWQRSRQSRPGR